ncbi:MAG: hypothetical protein NC337_03835 [Roseburia sp.]|nr:hypothetical protein [Roseburia sp.]
MKSRRTAIQSILIAGALLSLSGCGDRTNWEAAADTENAVLEAAAATSREAASQDADTEVKDTNAESEAATSREAASQDADTEVKDNTAGNETALEKTVEWDRMDEAADETAYVLAGKPFLEFYYPEDESLLLKLYYDAESGAGSGISYGYGADNSKVGFRFSGTENRDFALEEPYDFDKWCYYMDGSVGIDSGKNREDITNPTEQLTYNENGRPLRFTAFGDCILYDETVSNHPFIRIDYAYREDGSLFSKSCVFDSFLFGTYESTRTIYYDEAERAVYMEEYITHGSIQRYYIYEGADPTPSYCFVFDSGRDAFMVHYQ